jgi:hypothetical protein
MQLSVYQFYISTTCFGHIGPSSGTITIVTKADVHKVALKTVKLSVMSKHNRFTKPKVRLLEWSAW